MIEPRYYANGNGGGYTAEDPGRIYTGVVSMPAPYQDPNKYGIVYTVPASGGMQSMAVPRELDVNSTAVSTIDPVTGAIVPATAVPESAQGSMVPLLLLGLAVYLLSK